MYFPDPALLAPLYLDDIPVHTLNSIGYPIGHLTIDTAPFASNVRTHAYVGRFRRVTDGREIEVVAKWFRRAITTSETSEVMNRLFDLNAKVQDTQYIVPYVGCSLHMSRIILLIPYARNGNIAEYLTANPKADRYKLLLDVAYGLKFLHDGGLVHGDLRPENVLIMDDGTAKLTDFGLNEALGRTRMGDPPQELFSRETMGYCPPEIQSPDVRDVWDAPNGDVYMFGMLYAHIFEGAIPWTGLTLKQIVAAVFEYQIPPRPADDSIAAQNGFTEEDWEICLACWTTDPDVRPLIVDVMQMIVRRTRSST